MSDISTTDRVCTICKQSKPATEFYIQHTGKPNPVCKPCHLARAKTYPDKRKIDASNPHEQVCMEYMRSLGIHTVPGKASEFSWVDLVVWGCLMVEVKLGFDTGAQHWIFKFSDAQVKRRLLGDVVVLILPRETWEYHIFDALNPVFYKNGKLKTGVSYIEYPSHRKNRQDSIPLTYEMMLDARDKWDILMNKLPDLKAIKDRLNKSR